MYHGLLNVYKEAGWTSNDVVQKLRGIFRQKKIGHTGTLDPDATGVLVVALGKATRLVELLTDHDKEYVCVCKLGVTTDTQDLSGTVLETGEVAVDEGELRSVVQGFCGTYDQIPPMYSAVKVDGKRLYTLAREGKEVARKPRKATIYAISVVDTSRLKDEGVFTMETRCAKGVYIRTLCHDIGQALGCGAAMAHLTRTVVGGFSLESAKTIAEIEEAAKKDALSELLLPVDQVFRDCDKVVALPDALSPLKNGNPLRLNQTARFAPPDAQDKVEDAALYENGARVRVYDEAGTFYGIYRYDAKKRVFQTEKFLFQEDEGRA